MMTICDFNLDPIHPSWRDCIQQALSQMNQDYLQALAKTDTWLPGRDNIFNAFSMPVDKVNYILFGESPYPRSESANGYAFWDAAVNEIWSENGLSKRVNRATSLRNIIKMLLIAEGMLDQTQTTQDCIALLNKQKLVKNNQEFFTNFIQHGFLLLNATLVLQTQSPQKDAREWQPFMQSVLRFLLQERPQIQLILFGKIANTIDELIGNIPNPRLQVEHPYNLSFITNPTIIDFFKPMHLMIRQ